MYKWIIIMSFFIPSQKPYGFLSESSNSLFCFTAYFTQNPQYDPIIF